MRGHTPIRESTMRLDQSQLDQYGFDCLAN